MKVMDFNQTEGIYQSKDHRLLIIIENSLVLMSSSKVAAELGPAPPKLVLHVYFIDFIFNFSYLTLRYRKVYSSKQ